MGPSASAAETNSDGGRRIADRPLGADHEGPRCRRLESNRRAGLCQPRTVTLLPGRISYGRPGGTVGGSDRLQIHATEAVQYAARRQGHPDHRGLTARGNKAHAAHNFGMARSTFYRRLRQYGIQDGGHFCDCFNPCHGLNTANSMDQTTGGRHG
ncbi:helix-turn-helix domain-containing protein [Actinomycetospora sp. NBRC 106375]|uniref:helix-turn-helix domain-containing protein n=1 Tax=Actinomycetospora sp. NBRC 106375 TaxID=3032207 RepID=UPI0033229744